MQSARGQRRVLDPAVADRIRALDQPVLVAADSGAPVLGCIPVPVGRGAAGNEVHIRGGSPVPDVTEGRRDQVHRDPVHRDQAGVHHPADVRDPVRGLDADVIGLPVLERPPSQNRRRRRGGPDVRQTHDDLIVVLSRNRDRVGVVDLLVDRPLVEAHAAHVVEEPLPVRLDRAVRALERDVDTHRGTVVDDGAAGHGGLDVHRDAVGPVPANGVAGAVHRLHEDEVLLVVLQHGKRGGCHRRRGVEPHVRPVEHLHRGRIDVCSRGPLVVVRRQFTGVQPAPVGGQRAGPLLELDVRTRPVVDLPQRRYVGGDYDLPIDLQLRLTGGELNHENERVLVDPRNRVGVRRESAQHAVRIDRLRVTDQRVRGDGGLAAGAVALDEVEGPLGQVGHSDVAEPGDVNRYGAVVDLVRRGAAEVDPVAERGDRHGVGLRVGIGLGIGHHALGGEGDGAGVVVPAHDVVQRQPSHRPLVNGVRARHVELAVNEVGTVSGHRALVQLLSESGPDDRLRDHLRIDNGRPGLVSQRQDLVGKRVLGRTDIDDVAHGGGIEGERRLGLRRRRRIVHAGPEVIGRQREYQAVTCRVEGRHDRAAVQRQIIGFQVPAGGVEQGHGFGESDLRSVHPAVDRHAVVKVLPSHASRRGAVLGVHEVGKRHSVAGPVLQDPADNVQFRRVGPLHPVLVRARRAAGVAADGVGVPLLGRIGNVQVDHGRVDPGEVARAVGVERSGVVILAAAERDLPGRDRSEKRVPLDGLGEGDLDRVVVHGQGRIDLRRQRVDLHVALGQGSGREGIRQRQVRGIPRRHGQVLDRPAVVCQRVGGFVLEVAGVREDPVVPVLNRIGEGHGPGAVEGRSKRVGRGHVSHQEREGRNAAGGGVVDQLGELHFDEDVLRQREQVRGHSVLVNHRQNDGRGAVDSA